MRLKRLGELIHHSKRYPNCKSARVSVYFQDINDELDDPDAYTYVPMSRFVITRIVYKNHASKYFLNTEEKNFGFICGYLKEKGIDLDHNRFLILQGEVEQIALMKPKAPISNPGETGLLEFLEDIIGTSEYKQPICNLGEEVDQKSEEHRQAQNQSQISRVELGALEAPKNMAMSYVAKEKEAYSLQNMVKQVVRYESRRGLNNTVAVMGRVREGVEETREDKKNRLERNKEEFKGIKELKGKMDSVNKDLKECSKRFEDAKQADVRIKNDIKHEIQLEARSEEKSKSLKMKYQEMIEENKGIEDDLPGKENILENSRNEIISQEEELDTLSKQVEEKTTALQEDKQRTEREYAPVEEEFRVSREHMGEIERGKGELESRRDNMRAEIAQWEESIYNCKQELGRDRDNLGEAEAQGEVFREREQGQREAYRELERVEGELTNEISELRGRLNVAKHALSDSQSKSKILKELLEAQKNRLLSGIHGRLGDMGAIDDKFDIAATTSGSFLDAIICDTMEQGELIISYLRNKKIGRATIFAIEKISKNPDVVNNLGKSFIPPTNTLRLFDQITPKHTKYLPLFYFCYRNTLVAPDIRTASKVAYASGGLRVVTLDGKLIELSGTMSGGGKPKKGGMSSKLSDDLDPNEIDKMVVQERELALKIRETLHEKSQLESFFQDLTRQKNEFQQEKRKLEMNVDRNNKLIGDLEEKLKAQRERISKRDLDSEIEQLTYKVNEIGVVVGKKNQECQEYIKRINIINEQINEVGGEEFKTQKELVHSKRKLIKDLENEIMKMKHIFENSTAGLNRLQEVGTNIYIYYRKLLNWTKR